MRALQCACGSCDETASAVQRTLETLNLNDFNQALKQPNPTPTEALAWQVVWLLSITPTGLDALSAWQTASRGQAFDLAPRSKEKLQSLGRLLHANGTLKSPMKHPGQLFPELLQSSRICNPLLNSALTELLGDTAVWAANAIKNGFFSQAQSSDFDLINRRLEKVSCWAKRAQQPAGLRRLLASWHKSPFREFGKTPPIRGLSGITKNTKLERKLSQVVQNFESSSRFRLSSGHCVGVTTGMFSLFVSQLLTGLLLRFRVVLRMTHTRTALFELNMGPNSLEITLGIRKCAGREFGAAFGVGPDMLFLSAGAMVNVTASKFESGLLDGVCLRIPRYPQGDAFARQRAQAILSLLMTERPEGSKPILMEILQRFPEVSVGRLNNAVDQQHSGSLELELSAGLGISHVRALCNATVYAEREWSRTENVSNRSGSLRAHKQRSRTSAEAGAAAQIRLGFRGQLDQRHGFALSPGTLAGVSMGLASAGIQVRREVFKQDGAFSNKSFFELEYAHLEDFEQALAVVGKTESGDPPLKPLPLNGSRPSGSRLSYAHRHELKPEAKLWLNQLESLRILLALPGVSKAVDAQALTLVSNTQEHVLKSPENYRLTSLRCYAKQNVRHRFGLNLLGVLETIGAAQSTVLLSASNC